MNDPIRICIGTEPKLRVVEKVLKHSILKRTKRQVEFTSMVCDESVPGSEFWNNCPHGATGFSYRRWMIPNYFKYEGFGIYIDCDQVVLADIGELWDMPDTFPRQDDCVVWCVKKRAPLPSVMLINCAAAEKHDNWHPERLWAGMKSRKLMPQHVMRGGWMTPLQEIPIYWNHIDEYDPQRTKLLHYSNLRMQPWFYPNHPIRHLWEKCFREAIADGAVNRDEVIRSISFYGQIMKGYKRPPCGLNPYYRQVLESA